MENANVFKLLIFTSVLILQVKYTDEKLGTVIKVCKKIRDGAIFVFSVLELFDKQQDGKSVSNEHLLAEINAKIDSTKSDLIVSMLETPGLEIVNNIAIAVHSFMVDMRKILNAVDTEAAIVYEEDFIKFYVEHNVVKHVRFLTKVLAYTIPGQQFELLQQIAANIKCNLTALSEFAEFYMDLVSDGIALQVMYYRLTKSISLNRVMDDEWTDGLQTIQTAFDKVKKDCVGRFSELTKSDFISATSARALGENNMKKYIYNWTDVMVYAPIRTHQFHYILYAQDLLLLSQKTDHQNKIAIIGNRGDEKIWDVAHIKQILAKSELKVPAMVNGQAARKVGKDVGKIIRKAGYSVGAIVVYFEGDTFPEKETFTDEDSPVVAYVLSDVVLKYCHDSSACWLGDIPVEGVGRKTAAGKFKIYVYPHRNTNVIEYKVIGAGKPNTPSEHWSKRPRQFLSNVFKLLV